MVVFAETCVLSNPKNVRTKLDFIVASSGCYRQKDDDSLIHTLGCTFLGETGEECKVRKSRDSEIAPTMKRHLVKNRRGRKTSPVI